MMQTQTSETTVKLTLKVENVVRPAKLIEVEEDDSVAHERGGEGLEEEGCAWMGKKGET